LQFGLQALELLLDDICELVYYVFVLCQELLVLRQELLVLRQELCKRVFITNVKGTFFGMSESEEASKRR